MKRRQRDGKEIDIKDMETSHIKNCIKAIKEGRIMKDYIDGTYGSTAEECDAWYVDRSGDRKKVLNEFDKELNRREMVELEEENKKLKDEITTLKMHLSKEENAYCLAKENKKLKEEVERLQKVLYTITGSRDDGEPDLYEDY